MRAALGLSLSSLLLLATGCAGTAKLPLRSVVLYQNGLGYFERSGTLSGDRLRLRLRGDEVDDILKSLTVLGAGDRATIGSVASLRKRGADTEDYHLELTLPPGASHDLRVTYAAPTPVWRAAYRVVLGEKAGALVQGWAIVINPSHEDWDQVQLTLATGAPLSFQVDLHTPQTVARPDATGRFTAVAATGVVGSESAEASARDRVDTDQDRIPDVDDKCPNERETYNGFEDEDGCPDRGRVVITSSHIEILDKIFFTRGSAEVKPASRPILDAMASTLVSNTDITSVEIQGHAAADEEAGGALATRRASAVVAYLVSKGVAAGRLVARGYGATRPSRTGTSESDRAVNRRVELLILKRSDGADATVARPPSARPAPRPTMEALERSQAPAPATRVDVAGMSRFELKTPITIRHGTSAMISILNERTIGEEIYLYRPDPGAPGSALHPFRAARVRGPAGLTLEPGPAAIYARGTFVGDAVLDRLHAGQTTFLPFAVDSSTTVIVEHTDASAPVRLVTIARGVATVEDRTQRSTRYAVRAGADPPARIFVRHPRARGFELLTKPDDLQETEDAALLPLALTAHATTTLAVEERSPTRRTVELARAGELDLRAYLAGSTIPEALRKALEECVKLREELATLEAQEETTRKRSDDAGERQLQLRENLTAIQKNPRAESLRKELLARLTEAVKTGNELAAKLARLTSDIAETRARLESRVRDLALDANPKDASK